MRNTAHLWHAREDGILCSAETEAYKKPPLFIHTLHLAGPDTRSFFIVRVREEDGEVSNAGLKFTRPEGLVQCEFLPPNICAMFFF